MTREARIQMRATKARSAVRRLQWMIAFAVVVFPLVGVVAASVLFWNRGVTWVELTCLGVMYLVCMLGITVGFHRYFAHRSYDTSRPMRILLAICGSMAAQGPILFWVSTHRRHHAFSDKEGDPHSPNLHGDGLRGMLHGLWHAHIGWMFTNDLAGWAHFGRDVFEDRAIFRIHQQYLYWVAAGLALPAVFAGLATGTWTGALSGFLWGGLVRIFLVNHASWCVGSVCHKFGGKDYETHDHSANNYWVAVLTFGEGLQNNHHAFPGSFSHALHWWQPDLSAWVIRLMQWTGLAWNVKFPAQRAIEEARKKHPTEHQANIPPGIDRAAPSGTSLSDSSRLPNPTL